MRGDLEFTELLLELGANTETKDKLGRTALHWAAQIDSEAIMALLLEKGANREAQNHLGNTPLHRTAAQGKKDTLHWLLNHGANPNAQNNQGETPLMLAMKSIQDRQEKVTLLLKHSARLEIKDQRGKNGLNHLFRQLPAAGAETLLHQFSHLLTPDLLNDQDNSGNFPKDMIRDDGFKWFVEGLTFPVARGAALRAAEVEKNVSREKLLKQERFK